MLNFPHQLFQQVSDGDHAQHAAVFVQNHGVVGAAALHLLEEDVCFDGFGNKEGGLYSAFQNLLEGFVLEPEKIPGI